MKKREFSNIVKTMKDGIEIFRDLLRHYLSIKEGLQTRLAIETKIGTTQLNDFLGGRRNLSEPKKDLIARYLGFENFIDFVAKQWTEPPVPGDLIVITSDAERKFDLEDHAADYVGIPLYESGRLAAGVNGATFDQYEEPTSTVVVYRPEIKSRTNHDLRALRVGGDSMEPNIPRGSIVVVDLSDREFVNRKVYCVNMPEEGTDIWIASVKRVQRWNGGHILFSDNASKHPPVPTELEWRDLCVGRVIWMWRNIQDI